MISESVPTWLDDLLFLFLGWLLGILSPLLLDLVRKKKEIRTVRDGIFAELQEMQSRLVLVRYRLVSKSGALTKAFVESTLGVLETYPHQDEELKKMGENLKTLINKGDDEIRRTSQFKKSTEQQTLTSVKKIRLPYLDNKYNFISNFDLPLQYEIYQLRARVDILNEHIDEYRMFIQMALKDDGTQHTMIDQNIETLSSSIEGDIQSIVEAVAKFGKLIRK